MDEIIVDLEGKKYKIGEIEEIKSRIFWASEGFFVPLIFCEGIEQAVLKSLHKRNLDLMQGLIGKIKEAPPGELRVDNPRQYTSIMDMYKSPPAFLHFQDF